MSRPGVRAGLVGRGSERAGLIAALARARDGRAGAVLLGGDAGVGKSRLVAELADAARADGVRVVVGRCLDVGEASLPYLPFTEALATLRDAAPELVDARPALRRLLPGSAPDGSAGRSDRELAQLQLFDAVLSVLTDAATDSPLLLVLEDLHWADRSSRELVTFLLSRLGTQRLLVLATYRADDLHRRHPLRTVLAELVRLPAVTRTELGPLNERDTLALVRALADGTTGEDVLARIARRCEGNAFFAEEMVAACSDGLPDGLAEVLLARVERLSDPARALLRVASVADRRIRHTLLSEASGLGTDELELGLREAVAHHVLVPDGADAYAFRHALLREAVHDDLLPGERLHARMVGLLSARLDEPGVAAELARHALAAHDLPRALAASVRAALEADRRHGPAEMLLHAERALDLWSAIPDAEQVAGISESVLTREAAWAASASGDPERGSALARRAVQLADAQEGPWMRADARRRYALRLLDTGSRLQEAISSAAMAVELMDGIGPCADLAWGHAVLARALLRADLEEPARRHAGIALSVAEQVQADGVPGAGARTDGDVDAERRDLLGAWADALLSMAFFAQLDGDTERARALLADAVERAVTSGNRTVELRTLWSRGISFLEDGLLDAAQTEFTAGETRAAAHGISWSGYGLDHKVGLVRVAFQRGNWDDAVRTAASIDSGVSSGVAGLVSAAGLLVTVARGGPADAEREIAALSTEVPVFDQTILLLGQAGAESALWRGEPDVAARRVEAAIAGLRREVRYHLGELVLSALGVSALADQVEAGVALARQAADELADSAESVARHGLPRGTTIGPEGRAWLWQARAELTRARAEPDPGAWTAVVEAFGYGDVYRQAHARYRRAEASILLALRADVADAARLRRDAREDLQAAAAAADRLGAGPLADAVAALAARAGLPAGPEHPPAVRGPDDAPPAPGTAAGHIGAPQGAGAGATGTGTGSSGSGAAGASSGPGRNGGAHHPLTPRERAVLEQVANGLTNRRIGERLFISEKTVSVHLSRTMAKLGASGRAEAVSIAYRRGLLPRNAPTAVEQPRAEHP